MTTHTHRLLRSAALATLLGGSLLWSGCSTLDLASAKIPIDAVAKYSPVPQVVSPVEALEGAQDYVKTHPGSDYAIGSGDSMLPLYRDHAVIITERPAMSELHVGQTVIFMGSNGVPVAHTLIKHTSDGWVTMGLGNSDADEGTLTNQAYLGVVVKAYQPTGSVVLAYAKSAQHGTFYASNP